MIDRNTIAPMATARTPAAPNERRGLRLIGHQAHGVFGERHRDRGHRAAFDHEEQRPSIEEGDERMVRIAEIDVLAARRRQHRAELGVRPARRSSAIAAPATHAPITSADESSRCATM